MTVSHEEYWEKNVRKNNFFIVSVWVICNIRINNNIVLYKQWYQNGVKHVGNFLLNDGNFLSMQLIFFLA